MRGRLRDAGTGRESCLRLLGEEKENSYESATIFLEMVQTLKPTSVLREGEEKCQGRYLWEEGCGRT